MPEPTTSNPGFTWLAFSLFTVSMWGIYGIFLHTGQIGMQDTANGRYKAFLFVGIAYFLVAVLAPIAVLKLNGASMIYPTKGIVWSLLAGVVGAAGAFGVLLAFGAKGSPAVVMSIIFAGAPIVNAIVSLAMHPPAGGFATLRPQFLAGILLAALGGYLVTIYKPTPAPKSPAPAAARAVASE